MPRLTPSAARRKRSVPPRTIDGLSNVILFLAGMTLAVTAGVRAPNTSKENTRQGDR